MGEELKHRFEHDAESEKVRRSVLDQLEAGRRRLMYSDSDTGFAIDRDRRYHNCGDSYPEGPPPGCTLTLEQFKKAFPHSRERYPEVTDKPQDLVPPPSDSSSSR